MSSRGRGTPAASPFARDEGSSSRPSHSPLFNPLLDPELKPHTEEEEETIGSLSISHPIPPVNPPVIDPHNQGEDELHPLSYRERALNENAEECMRNPPRFYIHFAFGVAIYVFAETLKLPYVAIVFTIIYLIIVALPTIVACIYPGHLTRREMLLASCKPYYVSTRNESAQPQPQPQPQEPPQQHEPQPRGPTQEPPQEHGPQSREPTQEPPQQNGPLLRGPTQEPPQQHGPQPPCRPTQETPQQHGSQPRGPTRAQEPPQQHGPQAQERRRQQPHGPEDRELDQFAGEGQQRGQGSGGSG